MKYLFGIFSILILTSLLIFQSEARGENDMGSRPSWTRSKPQEDATYKYYLGAASESGSESQATTSARLKVREQAIRENFGGLMKIQTETYQNNSESQSVLQAEEVSPQVLLQDFEEVSVFVDSRQNLFDAWVLYRFKKSAIQKEKSRLNQLSKEDLFHSPTMAGSEESSKINGSIEIKTSPPGISVRIDGQSQVGEMELRTPLKLLGLFQPGEHVVELDDPRFKIWTKKVKFLAGATIQINEKMQPATGKLKVATNVDDARIKINHRPIEGTARSSSFELLAETAILIEITHPEMEPISKSLVLHRDENIIESFVLEQKPSFITILSQPSDAKINLDGREMEKTTPTRELPITRGQHKLTIEKDLYHPKIVHFEIKGGQKKIINVGTLQRYSPSELTEQVQAQRSTSSSRASISEDNNKKIVDALNSEVNSVELPLTSLPSFSMSFGVSVMGSPIQQVEEAPLFLSIGCSRMLGTNISIDGEFSFGGAVYKNRSDAEITDSILRYRLSLPVSFILGPKQVISLSPDIVFLDHSFTAQNASEPFATLSQVGTGMSLLIRARDDNGLIGFRLSVHQFSDVGQLKGQSTIMGGFEWHTGN